MFGRCIDRVWKLNSHFFAVFRADVCLGIEREDGVTCKFELEFSRRSTIPKLMGFAAVVLHPAVGASSVLKVHECVSVCGTVRFYEPITVAVEKVFKYGGFNTLYKFAGKGHVAAVRIHVNHLIVSPINSPVK